MPQWKRLHSFDVSVLQLGLLYQRFLRLRRQFQRWLAPSRTWRHVTCRSSLRIIE